MNWYCLRTAPQKELALAKILQGYGLHTFCPVETRWRRVPGTRRKRLRASYAMLPRYIFVSGGDPWSIIRAHRHRGVQGVVGMDGRPAPIPERAIARMMRISSVTPLPTKSQPIRRSFMPGDRAEIVEGPLASLVVEVTRIHGRAAEVIIPMLGSERVAEIPLEQLEAA